MRIFLIAFMIKIKEKKINMGNMKISEPRNMVPRILGPVEKWFQDFQVPFFTVLGVSFPAKYGTGSHFSGSTWPALVRGWEHGTRLIGGESVSRTPWDLAPRSLCHVFNLWPCSRLGFRLWACCFRLWAKSILLLLFRSVLFPR